MGGVSDESLYSVGPWPSGINNVAAEDALPRDQSLPPKPIALRDAVNVDLDNAGWPSRREGSTLVYTAVLAHSLWSEPGLPFGLLVDGGVLHAVDATTLAKQSLGLAVGSLPLSYARINDRVYLSNGVISAMIGLDLQVSPWAPEQPGRPELSTASGYSLRAGRYQVAVTFTDALGRESGTPSAVVVEVPDFDGAAIIAKLPAPGATTARINIYMTDADDSVLRLQASLVALEGVELEHLIGQPATGRALSTQFLEPMPAGHIVRYQNGRQYVARGREVLWSEPLRYGLWNPKNRVLFSDSIAVLEPVGDAGDAGIYVAAGERTYWLDGADPKDFTQRIVHSHGAVRGSALSVPAEVFDPQARGVVSAWLSNNGHFCIGMPGGKLASLKEGEAVVDGADSAAVMLREDGGIQRLTAALRAPRAQGLAVGDRAVAHVIHRGA